MGSKALPGTGLRTSMDSYPNKTCHGITVVHSRHVSMYAHVHVHVVPNSTHSCGVLQSYSVSSNISRGRNEGKVGVG